MGSRTIVIMPGDGIGPVVMQQALRVLDASGFQGAYIHADIGWESWCRTGEPLPQRTRDLLATHRVGLFGAITSKPAWDAQKELAPELQGKGLTYFSPIVTLRQRFDLDICMRPCITFPGNPLNFIRRGVGGLAEEPSIDTMVFRQNTECLYGGVEWSNPPDQVHAALMSHLRFRENFGSAPKEELAISVRVFTKKYTERILRAAFEYALSKGINAVTVCEKPNVLRETSGMMVKMAREMSKAEFTGIGVEETNIDAQMMWMTKKPERYKVIVSGNMFGDIVSDGFAGLTGGLGFASSANLGKEVAVFEPTHGSAPPYAGYDPPIVNPIAMILASCMMLDHLGESERAGNIRGAIGRIVREGKVRTYDMMHLAGSQQVLDLGAASTVQMADAIIARL